MKRLRYDSDDIAAWAGFSGDFNPVHFDRDVAARLGMPDVPVHGMRVMLDVKSALHRVACERPAAEQGALLFKATLRAPVLRDRPYQLHVDPGANRLKFSVVDETSGETCINGYLRTVAAMEGHAGRATARGAAAALPFAPGKKALAQQVAQFTALADPAQPGWMLLDSAAVPSPAAARRHVVR